MNNNLGGKCTEKVLARFEKVNWKLATGMKKKPIKVAVRIASL
jgi:hypothetical protein